jgi:hypothetical protein
MAASGCAQCGHKIGYEKRFYRLDPDEAKKFPFDSNLIHATCYEDPPVLDVVVTLKCMIRSVIDQDSLNQMYDGDMSKLVAELVDSEGIYGLVDSQDVELLEVTQVQPDGS